MLNIDKNTTLEILLAGAIVTNQLSFVVAYGDRWNTAYTHVTAFIAGIIASVIGFLIGIGLAIGTLILNSTHKIKTAQFWVFLTISIAIISVAIYSRVNAFN